MYTATWVNPKGIMLSDRSQSHSCIIYDSIYMMFSKICIYIHKYMYL